ncbi:hypothetical protein H2O64_10555 [Kordia sp. YSTF-M3]|uniref:DUF4132 domain-containing protein n=1 Tax=Kordia aestuariivivens TaxID=2759037 RepID=A0ABR7Q975_9FLAO|nr:DUF6493 family protein [Kordia aestuariivivens]MBC8755114.1 hypothetical protein [Kordia aestuariivivens]
MFIEELKDIVKHEKDVVPFLKKLTSKEKREFVPELKKLADIVFERRDVTEKTKWGMSYSSESTHTDKQRAIVDMARFVCFNKTEARRIFTNNNFLSNDDVIANILPWFIPKWYSDLLNETNSWGLTYEKLMLLYSNGYLEPSSELIVARLPSIIVKSSWENKEHKSFYTPEVLEEYKETLETHIWYLFEAESGINNFNYYNKFDNHKGVDDAWIYTIINLVEKQKLDREKTLIATIYTATKGFNQNLSGWFFDLLIKLNPTKEEVLRLQDEFYAALNAPHSKVVNTVLKYFKIVATDKKFKHATFVENASILLSSEVKSVVSSSLMMLDKIAKTHASSQSIVCKTASEALLHTDEKIQVRAAKIIEKYGDSTNEELRDEIEMYTDGLLYAAKEILSEYISAETEETNEEEIDAIEEITILSEENKLPVYETIDDLIFFVSQAIDNNEVYHIDLLLANLPKLNLLINSENASRLAPILKRSFDLVFITEWITQVGNIEVAAADYINDFGKMLVRKYPAELRDFWRYTVEKTKDIRHYERDNKDYSVELEKRSIPGYIYNLYRFLFIRSKEFIQKGQAFPLLSTPTHTPCWIAPAVFLDRILQYQNTNKKFDFNDYQIAIGRLPITECTKEITEKIAQIQSKELQEVLRYHFNLTSLKESKIMRPALWMQSILSKKNAEDINYFEEDLGYSLQKEMAFYTWACMSRERTFKLYDYQAGKYTNEKVTEKKLYFNEFLPKKFEYASLLTSIKDFFKGNKRKVVHQNSIYKFIRIRKQQFTTLIQPNDDLKFLLLTPNNPCVFLSQVIHNNLQESTFFDEGTRKNMINILKGLYEIWNREDYFETTYLFLATGFLCSDKVARDIAAEIWIKANSTATMNNVLLGKTLGKLQFGDYAPMKRFTDLITESMFAISTLHNKRLFELINAMISTMNDTPIRGVKKLLELFLELKRTFPEAAISDETTEKLTVWKTSKTLKAVVEKLI